MAEIIEVEAVLDKDGLRRAASLKGKANARQLCLRTGRYDRHRVPEAEVYEPGEISFEGFVGKYDGRTQEGAIWRGHYRCVPVDPASPLERADLSVLFAERTTHTLEE